MTFSNTVSNSGRQLSSLPPNPEERTSASDVMGTMDMIESLYLVSSEWAAVDSAGLDAAFDDVTATDPLNALSAESSSNIELVYAETSQRRDVRSVVVAPVATERSAEVDEVLRIRLLNNVITPNRRKIQNKTTLVRQS